MTASSNEEAKRLAPDFIDARLGDGLCCTGAFLAMNIRAIKILPMSGFKN